MQLKLDFGLRCQATRVRAIRIAVLDLLAAYFYEIAYVMEKDEKFNPIHVCLFHADKFADVI